MAIILVLAFCWVIVPSDAYAWGPLTHIFLGSETVALGWTLPAAVYALIRKQKADYLYGNLMADCVLAKKHLPMDKHPHNWEVAQGLYRLAETDAERAFCLGYMSHLAADTVAHGPYTAGAGNLGHSYLEMKADSLISRSYWVKALSISRTIQRRNDAFLDGKLSTVIFSGRTNRRIYKSYVAMAGIGTARLRFGVKPRITPADIVSPAVISHGSRAHIECMHKESLHRITQILSDPEGSEVLGHDPIGTLRRAG